MDIVKWKKRLALFCIGMCLGALGSNIYVKKWKSTIGWFAATMYACAWRFEMENKRD